MPGQNRFLERLQTGPAIVGDGGMGALLSAAVPRLRSPEEANLRAPEAVVSLHVSFINAGAELIETNTFGANRRKLAHNFLDDDLEALNSAGVKLTGWTKAWAERVGAGRIELSMTHSRELAQAVCVIE